MAMINMGTVHEKRGDDFFHVLASETGDVIRIEQYDSRAAYPHFESIAIWSDTVPKLVELIQKAAGVEPEWEYAVRRTDKVTGETELVRTGYREWTDYKEHAQAIAKTLSDNGAMNEFGHPIFTYKTVKRQKPMEPKEYDVD